MGLPATVLTSCVFVPLLSVPNSGINGLITDGLVVIVEPTGLPLIVIEDASMFCKPLSVLGN
jgi:hypothetical protein